jgi:hypothetical protein
LQVDSFFYRDPEEAKEEEVDAAGPMYSTDLADYSAASGGRWASVDFTMPVLNVEFPMAEGLYSYILKKFLCMLFQTYVRLCNTLVTDNNNFRH